MYGNLKDWRRRGRKEPTSFRNQDGGSPWKVEVAVAMDTFDDCHSAANHKAARPVEPSKASGMDGLCGAEGRHGRTPPSPNCRADTEYMYGLVRTSFRLLRTILRTRGMHSVPNLEVSRFSQSEYSVGSSRVACGMRAEKISWEDSCQLDLVSKLHMRSTLAGARVPRPHCEERDDILRRRGQSPRKERRWCCRARPHSAFDLQERPSGLRWTGKESNLTRSTIGRSDALTCGDLPSNVKNPRSCLPYFVRPAFWSPKSSNVESRETSFAVMHHSANWNARLHARLNVSGSASARCRMISDAKTSLKTQWFLKIHHTESSCNAMRVDLVIHGLARTGECLGSCMIGNPPSVGWAIAWRVGDGSSTTSSGELKYDVPNRMPCRLRSRETCRNSIDEQTARCYMAERVKRMPRFDGLGLAGGRDG